MRNLSIFLIGSYFFFGLLSSVISGVEITGDVVEFINENEEIRATGNVSIVYNRYTVGSEDLIYNLSSKNVYFRKKFHVKHPKYDIHADTLYYDMANQKGRACAFGAQIGRLHFKGKNVSIEPLKIILNDATFTTCDQRDSHTFLKANKLYIYPDRGYLVALDNWLQVPFLPFQIWMPSFIYGSEEFTKFSTPLPLVGSNRFEGGFIRQEFSYFLSSFSSGVLGVGTSKRLGEYFGINHQLILNATSMINLELRYVRALGVQGGFTHRFVLHRDEPDSDKDPILSIFQPSHVPSVHVVAEFQNGQIIEDSSVNKYPWVQIFGKNQYFDYLEMDYTWKFGIGRLEELTYQDVRNESRVVNTNFNFQRSFEFSNITFGGSFNYDGYWYDRHSPWQRLFFSASLKLDDPIFDSLLTVRKAILNSGQSPFLFQSIYAVVSDEVGIRFSREYLGINFEFIADYAIQDWDPRQLKLQVGKTFHCWGVDVSWESVRDRLNFGIRIF